ncbi:MAG: hypothetical protein MI723_03600, partial [Caulobacterales bacterium]|nr:hypothetical protein [Caulobacterales bacterium]
EETLARRGAQLIRSPSSLSLHEALQMVLEVVKPEGPVFLLHGDTLVQADHLDALDRIAIDRTDEYYVWADVERLDDGGIQLHSGFGDGRSSREVACGYFTFSSAAQLRRCLVESDSFIGALNAYNDQVRLDPLEIEAWHDFGHLPLLFQSKRDMLSTRAFNRIQCDGVSVTKSSRMRDKILAEADWYRSIPESLRPFTPQFFGSDDGEQEASCSLEYLYQPTLAELYVFGKLPIYVWRKILTSCLEFFETCRSIRPADDHPAADPAFAGHVYDVLIARKSIDRLQAFCDGRCWDLRRRIVLNGRETPPLRQVLDALIDAVSVTTADHIRLWHGDFFFGNLFYDFRASRIRAVDPRGGLGGEDRSLFSDWRYDVAKLSHSIYGAYDFILAGRMDFQELGDGHYTFARPGTKETDAIVADYAARPLAGAPILTTEIKAMTALLFLSMLPLHAESPSRQNALLANALDIHRELFGEEA